MYFRWIDFICAHLAQNPFTQGATMCRWFAYISQTERCLLEDVLIDPAHSISKQVHDHYLPKLSDHEPGEDPEATKKEIALRNKLFNADGLGVAW